MRPWYKHTAQNDEFYQPTYITPFSKIWGFGAPVTLALIIVNSAIWLLMVVSNAYGWLPLDTFWYKYFAMTPHFVVHNHWLWQLITSIFLHDGSNILHLAMNMYVLWIFGPRVERTFGSRNFVFFYLATGFAGSLLSFGMHELTGYTGVPSLGASSSIFGVLTAYGFLFPNDMFYIFGVLPLTAWKTVVLFIVAETLMVLFNLMENVDHYAHLGGAAAAAIWMLFLFRTARKRSTHEWHNMGQNVNYYIPRARPKHGGFKLIIGNPRQDVRKDHPEGTDDEPPPSWFKE